MAFPKHIHSGSNTHTQSHSFGAFHTYGKQEVHYTDGTAMGLLQLAVPFIIMYRCVSAAGTTSGILRQ